MLQKLFPNTDASSLNPKETEELNQYLLGHIPEDELLNLAAVHSRGSFEGHFQTFLNRRLSEAILMEEKNENQSKAMDFLLEL